MTDLPDDLKAIVLSLKPGEALVFKTDYRLNKEQVIDLRENIRRQLERFGLADRFMLVTHGVQVEIGQAANASAHTAAG